MGTPKPNSEKDRRSLVWLWVLMVGVALGVLAIILSPASEPKLPPIETTTTVAPSPTPVVTAEPTPTPEPPVPTPASLAQIDVAGLHASPTPTPVRPAPRPQIVRPSTPPAPSPTSDAKPPEPVPNVEPASALSKVPLPEVSADVRAAIATLAKCPTMQSCIQGADAALAMFGSETRLPDPGAASIGRFDEVKNAYRRAQAEALRVAKELAARPGGPKHESDIRAAFEAIPRLDEWVIADAELLPIRAALQRLVGRWTAEQRLAPGTTLGLEVRVLLPAGGRAMEIEFAHDPSPFPGLTDLKDFIRRELPNAKEIKTSERQRLATVKVVVSPAGDHAVD